MPLYLPPLFSIVTMNDNQRPTSQDVEQLLKKYEVAASAKITWKEAYPNYPDSVFTLMDYITSSVWCNPNYPASEMHAVFKRLDTASIEDVQSMLTSIVRADRFCTGYWQSSIQSGQLKSVIDRAMQLLDSA